MTYTIAYQRQINANFARQRTSGAIAKKVAIFLLIAACIVAATQF